MTHKEEIQLKANKKVKCDEIDHKRDEMQSLSLKYTFPDGQVGHIQRRNQKDERNIQGVASAAMSLVLSGNTTTKTVHFTDEENVKHKMTGQEGMAFGTFVQQDYAVHQEIARAHKDAVNALTTVEDVQNYNYSGGWDGNS